MTDDRVETTGLFPSLDRDERAEALPRARVAERIVDEPSTGLFPRLDLPAPDGTEAA